jgi:type IV secretion system protein TrbL
MATADPAVLDDFLNKFRTQVDAGFGLIQGDVSATLASLVVISIVITALMWAIDENQNVLASLVRKILLVGFFAFLVTQWPTSKPAEAR